jgi:hypothetical protein
MAFVKVQTQGRQKNRVDPALPTHDALSSLVFRSPGAPADAPPLAILVVFGAHATVNHPVPPRMSGDYPAALVSELKRTTGARSVLFASGAVGDASPARPKATSQWKSAEALGVALASDLMTTLPSARFTRDVEVGNLRLDVDLPPVRLPFFGSKLRFSPLLTWWIADQRTHLHALRLGPAVLVGFPGDYSGHLADQLDTSTHGLGLSTIATSFDGDFRGYLVSQRVFQTRDCYETRLMNFYGPWTGEYFNDVARRMVERFSTNPVASSRPRLVSSDFAPRIALAVLLAAGVAVSWRRRGEIRSIAGRAGLLTVGAVVAAVLAFVIEPNVMAWAKFGLPWWFRMMGLPLGIAALAGSGRWTSGRIVLVFGAACGLLAASWVVVLLALRGWAKAGRSGSEAVITAEADPVLVVRVELAKHRPALVDLDREPD